jgi:hypothetical protein
MSLASLGGALRESGAAFGVAGLACRPNHRASYLCNKAADKEKPVILPGTGFRHSW